jgi:peptidyl-prolyl cis-trans isomerase B (cyclophilin B)
MQLYLSVSFALSLNMAVKKMAMTRVLMKTLLGEMTLELDAEKAPATVANFVAYAEAGHYDGTIFHRVINNFMVQGGGFDTEMRQKASNDPITNEANNGLKNDRGTIAMARTMDPHSATAQFFINVSDNDFLNFSGENMQGWGYAVFGRVVEGEDVLTRFGLYQQAVKQVIRTFQTTQSSSNL